MGKNKGTYLFVIFGVWGLLAANGIKDFYFEMRAKSSGEIISYSSLQEFCGWTGDRKIGETDFQYGFRRVKNMFSALMAMTFMAVLLFGLIFGAIFGVFYWSGAFKDEEA